MIVDPKKIVATGEWYTENEEAQKLIKKMMGGESLYIVDTHTDKFTILQRSRYLTQTYAAEESYSEQIMKYISSDVHERFRDDMAKATAISNLVARTNESEEYVQEYIDISSGLSLWYRMRARKLSDTEILLGFANKDKEISDNLILAKIKNDYFAMFGVNLDEGRMKVLKSPEKNRIAEVGESVPYNESMASFASLLKGEARSFFLRIGDVAELRRMLAKEDKITFSYKSDFGDGKKWVNMTGYVILRHDDGSPFLFSMGFSFLDAEASEKEERNRLSREAYESQKLVDSIISSYNIAYLVNMKDDSFKELRMDKFIYGYGIKFDNFSQAKSFFLSAVLHPADRTTMQQELEYDYIRKRLSAEKSYEVEYRALLKGATVWHEMNVTYIDDDNVAISFVEKDLEITKRHLQQKRYEDYFALYVVDIDTEIVKVAKASPWYSTGAENKPSPYKPLMQAFAASLDEEPQALFMQMSDIEYVKRILSKEDKHTFSYRSKNVYGGRWVIITSFVTNRHADGSPAEFSLGFSYADSMDNITKDVQAQLREDMQMIGGLAEEYLALFYVNMDDNAFKAYSLDKEFLQDWNHFLGGDIHGPAILQAYGKSEHIHPDDRHLFDGLNNESIRQRLTNNKKFSIRFRRNFNGSYRWLEMDIVKYESIDERPNAIAIGFADRDKEIRHEQEQQNKLKSAYKAAEVANESKTNFLFNMSHDIRTPMNAITGFTSMAKKYVDDKEKVLDYLDKIDLSSQQLLQLINQVLEMSRIESGKIEFNYKPVNIKERFDAMVTILSEQAAANGLDFYYSLSDMKHNKVLADDARMGQITLNIAGNALKYTPKGGRIDFMMKEIPARRNGYATFVFSVKDNGIGMSKEFMKNLFQPFAREKSSTVSKIQGTGLGLSIVKNLVDLLGGEIKVESERGKGTRFDITLDFRIDEANAAVHTREVKTKVDFKGRRALLVEDNELNREIARFILEEQGLVIDEAEDGDIAVKMVKDAIDNGDFRHYDFILMDVQMPKMNGYEATALIHAMLDPLKVHIPIIAVSANAFEEDKQKSHEAGMDDHIAKPINIDQLWATLAKYL